MPGAKPTHFVYVPLIEERRILVFSLDTRTGKLTQACDVPTETQPWQVCVDPQQRFLYQQIRDGEAFSGIASYRIDQENGNLTKIGQIELDAWAVYVNTDRTGRFIFAACMVPGFVTVHAIGDDGAILPGPVDRHDTGLYAHSILSDRSNRYAYVPHVSPTDSIAQFLFDDETGRLTPNEPAHVHTGEGGGPRHFAFHPSLDVVYFNVEALSEVAVFGLDPDSGSLTLRQKVSTLPSEYEGKNTTASVRVHPRGGNLYVPNRGHDSIASFSIDDEGLLCATGHVSSQPVPRPVGITAAGDYFFSGSDDTDTISSYRIKPDGLLEPLEVSQVGRFVAWILPLSFT